MGNLWIGPPGAMVEIDQAAKSFDRTADLGTSEFRSLGGRVTLTRNLAPVRRLKLAWDLLAPAHARALDRIARRVDSGRPVAVVDPAAGNLLDPQQALGRRDPGMPMVQWYLGNGSGSITATAAGDYVLNSTDAAGKAAWCSARWPDGRFPVAPGIVVSFRPPASFTGVGAQTVQITWRDSTGAALSTTGVTGSVLTATAPAGACSLTPYSMPGAIGTYSLAGACLTYGGTAENGIPGDGLPPMSVTAYTDAPGRPLPYRSIGLDLVEVSSAAG
ncbi:hypothetical protein ABZ896_06045 [Streptomyces sp. NPDC047072]|uniref:hypothetical protein n=1 Tax=Streptomyces sp. NPDC047072 TaxID=3154809 RepID=UPI0033FB4E18